MTSPPNAVLNSATADSVTVAARATSTSPSIAAHRDECVHRHVPADAPAQRRRRSRENSRIAQSRATARRCPGAARLCSSESARLSRRRSRFPGPHGHRRPAPVSGGGSEPPAADGSLCGSASIQRQIRRPVVAVERSVPARPDRPATGSVRSPGLPVIRGNGNHGPAAAALEGHGNQLRGSPDGVPPLSVDLGARRRGSWFFPLSHMADRLASQARSTLAHYAAWEAGGARYR